MIQLKSFADDGRVVVKVTLPEAVMKHHDGQRFLSLGESKGPRLWPSKGGTPRVEDASPIQKKAMAFSGMSWPVTVRCRESQVAMPSKQCMVRSSRNCCPVNPASKILAA